MRDNPQLCQNLALTNFYSLREWFMWNCNQTGAVNSLMMPSTDLHDVELMNNRLEYANFSGQTNLHTLLIGDNLLTNLIVTNCFSLTNVEAQGNRLTTAVLDSILTNLSAFGRTNGHLDLFGNSQSASEAGYAAADNLQMNRGWDVTLDGLGYGSFGDSNSITFVTYSQGTASVAMELYTNGAPNIVWHWADGTVDSSTAAVSHTFRDTNSYWIRHTNYVSVTPRSGLSWFRKQLGRQQVTAVYGVSNFQSLEGLYLCYDDLSQMSLSNCSPLMNGLELAHVKISSEICDQWFIDLDNAASSNNITKTFYFSKGLPTGKSQNARDSLIHKNWTMIAIP